MEKNASEITRYENVTVEQWTKLKDELFKAFRFRITQNQAKIQWGSTVSEWDTGVFEWDYRLDVDPEAKPGWVAEKGTLEIRIKRRPADPAVLAVESNIAQFLKKGK